MEEIAELREEVSLKGILFENIDGENSNVDRYTRAYLPEIDIKISATRNTTDLQTKLARERTEDVVARGYFTLIYSQIEFAFAKLQRDTL